MKYLVYDTEAEAISAEAAITESKGFTGNVTSRWATPQQRLDGKWVFQSPNDEGVEYEPSWMDTVVEE